MGIWDRVVAHNRKRAHYKWMGAKFVFAGLGMVAVYLGGDGIFSHLAHERAGTVTTATYQGQRTACQFRYVLASESDWKSKEMDCDAAEALKKRQPGKKVEVKREEFLSVGYLMPDGRRRNAEIKRELGANVPAGTKVGDQIQVVYRTDDPTNVRMPFGFAALTQYLTMIGMGLGVLALVFVRRIVAFCFAARQGEGVDGRTIAVPAPAAAALGSRPLSPAQFPRREGFGHRAAQPEFPRRA